MKRTLKPIHIIICLTLFFGVWTGYTLLLKPLIETGSLWGEIFGSLIKLAVWTLPAVILLLKFPGEYEIPFGEMLRASRNPLRNSLLTAGGVILAGAAIILGAVIRTGKLSFIFSPIELISTVLFVGITEEALFRGFLLNALLKKIPMEYAMAVSSVLFVLIHFPIWILEGVFSRGGFFILAASLQVCILGSAFGWVFIKTRSLIYPIILHMAWNLFIIMFAAS